MSRRRPNTGAFIVCLILVTAQVPWRSGVLYQGGADVVVLAKGALTVTALGLALAIASARHDRLDVPASPFLWVGAFVACTLLGAAAAGNLAPTMVLAGRLLLVLLVIAVLMSTYSPQEVLHAVIASFGVLALVATLTGLAMGTADRLSGGVPPLHPNELASLTTMCLIWVVAGQFRGDDRTSSVVLVPACVAVILLTGSRASLIAGAAALIVLTLFATRVRVGVACVVAAVPAIVFGMVVLTPVVDQVVIRGEDASRLATFADRLIAWQAAIASGESTWYRWFGGGLSQKTVEVTGQWWSEQALDSSWVSALVQAGWLGLMIGACWVVSIVLGLLQAPREWRGVLVSLTVFLALRGFLESGLFDASASFIALSTLAFASMYRHGPGPLLEGNALVGDRPHLPEESRR